MDKRTIRRSPVTLGRSPVTWGAGHLARAVSVILFSLFSAAVLAGAASSAGPSRAAEPAPNPSADRGLHGPQPFVTILCKYPDVADEPRSSSYYQELFGSTYPGLDDYWREVSYGAINLQGSRVVGWYTLPHPSSDYRVDTEFGFDLDRLAQDCTAAADADVFFPDYVGVNLVFNYFRGTAGGGKACLTLDGQSRCIGTTWLWGTWASLQSVVAHEMGHAFGLPHSSAGSNEVYGDAWDIMSGHNLCRSHPIFGSVAQDTIAYHKDLLGWIPADRKFIASPGARVTITLEQLARPSQSDGTPQTGHYLMAQIPIAGSDTHFYTVEARRQVGYDSSLPADAVVIHEVDTTADPPAHLVNRSGDGDTRVSAGMWQPGTVFVDAENDIAVSVDSATPTGFVVTLDTRALPWPLTPADRSMVYAGELTFGWKPIPGAAGYLLQVHTVHFPVDSQRSSVTLGAAPSTGSPQKTRDFAGQAPSLTVSISQTLVTAEARVSLPRGSYVWRARALPGGDWTPASHIEVGRTGGRWLPSELIATPATEVRAGPAIAIGPDEDLSVAWAEATGEDSSATIHVARRIGSAWEFATSINPKVTGLRQGQDGDGEVRSPVTLGKPAIAVGPGGALCAAWGERQQPVMTGSTFNTDAINVGVWGGCWQLGLVEAQTMGDSRAAFDRVDQATRHASRSNPAVAVDEAGNAYAVWEEAGQGGDSDVYFAWRPAGESWTAQHKINDDTGRAPQWNPAIAVDAQGNVHVAWADGRSGRAEIYAAYRSAGGTWEANVRLSDAGSKKHVRPVIAVDSQGSAYAAWQSYDGCAEAEPMGDIQFAMRPAGSAWGPAVTVSSDIGGIEVSTPAIAATSEAGTYLVWEEKSAGTYTLYSAYRTTTGTWEPKTKIAESAGNAAPSNPALAANAMGNAYVAWIDSRPGHSGLRFAMAVR